MPLPASPPRASLPPETVTLPKHLLQSQISVLNTNFKLLKDRIASTNAANARLRLQLDKHQELYELFGHCATINLDDVVNSSNPEDEEEDDGYWNDGHQSGHQGGHSSLLTQADVRAITQTVYDHAASTIAAVTSKNNLLTLENERLRSDIFALTKASRLASLTPSKVIKSDVNEGVVGLQVCSDMLASARMSLAGDLVLLSSPGTAESPVKTHTIQELADASLEDSVGGVGEQGEEFKIDAQTAQIEREVTKSLLPHKSGPGPVQDDGSVGTAGTAGSLESEMIEVTEKYIERMEGANVSASKKKKKKEKKKEKKEKRGTGKKEARVAVSEIKTPSPSKESLRWAANNMTV